eukprot:2305775-Lingulodinium_polyedra.AAC.1
MQLLSTLQSSGSWRLAPRPAQGLLSWALKLCTSLVEDKQFKVIDSKMHQSAGAAHHNETV